MPPQKRRNPWLAGIGNLLYAPLGHVYAGQAWRGVLLCAAIASITVVAVTALAQPAGWVGLVLTALELVAAAVFLVADGVLVARRQGNTYQLKWYNRWYIYLLTIAAAGGTTQAVDHLIRANVVESYYVASQPMTPTLLMDERVMVDKLAYRSYPPERYDVVLFKRDRHQTAPSLMRVIGLPGETIEIRQKKLCINGRLLPDSHAHFNGTPLAGDEFKSRDSLAPTRIPAHHYFILGDNRDDSYDSRFCGPIAREQIYGVARSVFWFWDPERSALRWERMGKPLK